MKINLIQKIATRNMAGNMFMVLFLILLNSPAYSQVPDGFKILKDTAAFNEKMTAQSKLTNTTECDFEQEKYISVMSEKIISKGHFCFKKENKLRWEYNSPFKYLIVINSGKMFIKDNGKVSKYDINSNKMFKSINEMMMSIVQGTLFNDKNYDIRYCENDKQYLLILTPRLKGTKEFLKTINLYINKKDFSVVKVKMVEPGGDYNSLNFTNRKTNEPIADAKFVIK